MTRSYRVTPGGALRPLAVCVCGWLAVALALVAAPLLRLPTLDNQVTANQVPLALTRAPEPADPLIVRWLSASGLGERVLSALAVDVDRDGDLDVLVATVHDPVEVWTNQGRGRLVRQPRASPEPRSLSHAWSASPDREGLATAPPKSTGGDPDLFRSAVTPLNAASDRVMAHTAFVAASRALRTSADRAPPRRALV